MTSRSAPVGTSKLTANVRADVLEALAGMAAEAGVQPTVMADLVLGAVTSDPQLRAAVLGAAPVQLLARVKAMRA